MAFRCALLVIVGSALLAQTPPASAVEGHVTDAVTGAPIADATITASNGQRNFTGKTDAGGHFILPDLPPGSYGFLSSKEGYEPGTIRRQTLVGSPNPQQIDFQLSEGGVLSGQVLDEGRNPVAHAAVSLRMRTFVYGRPVFTIRLGATTDESGEYRFEHLHPGQYFVFSRPNPGPKRSGKAEAESVMTFYPDALSLETAAPISLRLGERRDRVDITLRKAPAFCARGSVTGSGSVPVSLTLSQAAAFGRMGDLAAVNLDKNGGIEICGLASGPWSIRPTATGANGTGPVFETSFEIADHDVDLGALTAIPSQPIQGTIAVDGARSDEPFPQGVVVVADLGVDGAPRLVRGDLKPNGGFSFPSGAQGPYWLNVRTPPGNYVRDVMIGGASVLYQPIRPGSGDVQVLLGSDGAMIGGQAVDSNNQPVAEATVILAPAQLPERGAPGLIQVVQSDSKGGFRFLTVAPGDYLVLALSASPKEESESPDFVRAKSGDATRLTLQPRDRQTLTVTVR